ncbi:hypothetical protein C8R42DRAFT_729744 [Lentinula raphanica]|nr:hypothetical protein C8R42DRAFT_729744 [Lentinula raphanica]
MNAGDWIDNQTFKTSPAYQQSEHLAHALNQEADPFERVMKDLYSVYLDMNHEEVTATIVLLGVAAVSVAGLGLVVFNVLQRCHVFGVRTYCWVTGCKSWLENDDLEQREKAVKLERAKLARQALNLSLEVEIKVCQSLREMHGRALKLMENRQFGLEKEKEALLEEILRDEHDAGDEEWVKMDAE